MTARLTDAALLECFTPEPNTGCWIWTGSLSPNGYGNAGTRGRAHRRSYEIHKGPVPAGLWVLHSCDNRACINPAHLRAGTRRENIDDMMRRNRRQWRGIRGEANASAKLTTAEVGRIREMLALGLKHGKIAQNFGVSRSTVQLISVGKTWGSSP